VPTGAQRRMMRIGLVLDRHPKAQRIFDRENDEGDDLDVAEERAIVGVDRRHRFQGHGDQVDDNQQDQRAADGAGPSVPHHAMLEQDIDAPAQA
jgi:hypothetical protein